jgi:putative ABC transport system permease protein
LTQKAGKAYPALVDADVLTWSLGMKLGDTLHYQDKLGNDVPIILAGTISNSIFQGHILIDRSFFREIWKEIGGSEIFLLKVKDDEVSSVKTVLTQALSEYGVRVTPTNERLKEFNEVTDTYLNIFLTLGGFGLLLGIMSFIIVIRKNLTMRRKEISLFRMLGYADGVIGPSLIKENLMVPLYAIATGVISSLVGVSISFMNAGAGVWLLALMFAVLFMLCVVIFVRQSVRQELTHYELVNTDRE